MPRNLTESRIPEDPPLESRVAREEVFGPVALTFPVKDPADAVALANDSVFGLGSSVWTKDPAEQEFFARDIFGFDIDILRTED